MANKKRNAHDAITADMDDTAPPRKTRASRSARSAPITPPIRITQLMGLDAPRRAVLNIAELLEIILLFLPARSVYSACRVSQQWNALVETSIAIQRKLLIKPSTPKQAWQVIDRSWSIVPAETPPLLEFNTSTNTPVVVTPVIINPLLAASFEPLCLTCHAWPASWDAAKFTISDKTMNKMDLGRPARSSLLSQLTDPPCQKVVIERRWQYKEKVEPGGWERRGTGCTFWTVQKSAEDGVTFGDLFHALQSRGPDYPTPSRANSPGTLDTKPNGTHEWFRVKVFADPEILLYGVVIPSEGLWRQMAEVGRARILG